MARTVASLSVSINAKTAGLRKGLRSARREVSTFAGQVKSLTVGISKIATGIAAVGGAIVVGGTAKMINSLDSLAKTSDKLSGIKPDALIALRDAAQESGVEVKTFDMGLQRMLRRIQEASQGKGEALGVLDQLKLDAKELVKLAPEEQFVKIAKAMKAGADDGVDLSRAMKLFDSEGVALINTLKLINNVGLQKFLDDVKKSGRSVKRDQLRPIESVNDRIKRMGDRITGFFSQLAVAVAGPLDKTLGRIEKFLNEPEQVKAIANAFDDMAKTIVNAANAIEKLLKNWREIKAEAQSVTGGVVQDAKNITNAVGNFIGGNAAALMQPTVGGFQNVLQNTLDDSARMLGDTPDRIKNGWDASIDAVKSALERVPAILNNAVSNQSAPESGRVFRLERNGQPVPYGANLGQPAALLEESKRQTQLLQEINHGTNPASIPKGTFVLVRG